MKTRRLPVAALPLLLAVWALPPAEAAPDGSWPSWRVDVEGSGVAPEDASPPLEWGSEKNVRWRVELPEEGNSTPAVWGDRVFVTQPVTEDNWRGLLCFDRRDGSLLWKSGLVYEEEERSHRTNLYCSASPATDGERVVVSFGSAGLVAYDFDGAELWHRDLGAIDHTWGNSSSPVIHGGLVIHYHGPDEHGNAVLYGFDKSTGETVWQWNEPVWDGSGRTDGFGDRDTEGVIGAFSTPIVVQAGEREELIMSFPMEMKAFDPATGEELWSAGGLNPLVYTSPVHEDGIVVAMGGYQGNTIAVRTGGSGDVTETHRIRHHVRHNGGIGTGVVLDGHHYYQTTGGILYCEDLETGETVWRERLPGAGQSWGSFVVVGDLIYTLSQAGDTVVFRPGPGGFELVAQSDVGEHTNSSLVFSGGDVFLRTHEALWCLSEAGGVQ